MQGSEMKKPVFILIIGSDLSECSGLISRIQQSATGRNFYKASDSLNFIEALKAVEDAGESVLQTEVRVIIDLDLPFFEAYVCLQALAGYDYQYPVRVYLLEGEHTIKASPSIEQYIIAGRFRKPLKTCAIECILKDHKADYFQKEVSNIPDAPFNRIL